MSITVTKDLEALTMSVTATFAAPVDRVWEIFSDPRKLERWWGPPTHPATVHEHELVPGGRVAYTMTGPDGDTHGGWWRVLAVEAPHRLEVEDGFADATGQESTDLPTMLMRVSLTPLEGGGTTMVVTTTFPTLEAMEQLLEMGMEEGITAAAGQIEPLLR